MDYIEDHEIIKLWNIYKPMIYLKDGLHRRPCFRSNVDQYTKPSQIKKFKVARKRAMTQRKCYSASILSIKNRRKNNNLQSGYSREFLLLFGKE